jgi:hypothetical protein
MKTIFQLILLFTFFSALTVTGQGIIIDHTSTNLDEIPLSVIDDVQENIRFHYAHTSHGDQLLCGLQQIEDSNPIYEIEIGGDPNDPYDPPYLPNVAGALCIYNGNGGYKYIVPEGYWLEPGNEWTQSTLNSNPTLNVSAWAWCTQLDEYSQAQVQEYLDQMDLFEQEFPNVTFIYTTGNAQSGGSWGYNRHMRCNQIRNYCIANNKILYDFEDLDSWYNGEMNYFIYNNDTIPLEHSAYNGDECGHVNNLSTLQKGKAVWWMMAKLRGWQQDSGSLNIKVFLEGAYNGLNMNTDLTGLTNFPLSQPYSGSPWNYPGNETVGSIPPDIVDWILVEYRDATTAATATPSAIIGKQAAFLRNDGYIVGLDGLSKLQFSHSVNHQLFAVIWHRNHLGIMSAYPVNLIGNIYSYDFTTSSSQAYGTNAQKSLESGFYGLFMGDMDSNMTIEYDDLNNSWKADVGKQDYLKSDVNMNRNVSNQDKNENWQNNIGKTCLIPQ